MAYFALTTGGGGATESLTLMVGAVDPARFEKHVVVCEIEATGALTRLRAATRSVRALHVPALIHWQGSRLDAAERPRIMAASAAPIEALVAFLREEAIEILHVNTIVLAHVLGPVRRALPRLRIVTHVRELLQEDALGTYMRDEIAAHSDAIIAISDNEARAFGAHPRVRVLPNPFDFAALGAPTSDFRRRHGISVDRVLVGMVARFSLDKGHLEFLAGMRAVLDRGVDPARVLFVLVGVRRTRWWKELAKRLLRPRALTLQLARTVRTLRLRDHTLLVPFTDAAGEVLRALDIVVRPSRAGDPWGRDVLEAMAYGKPVVATGTSQFYVQEGRTGFLVPPGDPQAMAERVAALVADPARREALGAAGRERVREMCDLGRHGADVMSIYERLLDAASES